MVKINFHGGKNQFSSPVIPANFYVRTGNTLIWLAGIRGKTCSNKFYRECQPIKFYREWQPIKWECYKFFLPRNASQTNESVTCACVAGTEVCGCHGGWKLIFTTVEIDFYHRGNFFLPVEIFSIALISSNKFTQVALHSCMDLWNFVSSSSNKFTQVQPCHHRWSDQWRLQWVGGCLKKSTLTTSPA